ncbi:unnamed protein product [Choristocarpus tenellus]
MSRRKTRKRRRVEKDTVPPAPIYGVRSSPSTPCLSFSQPFTSLVLSGRKTVDSRWGSCLHDLFRRKGETDVMVYCAYHDIATLGDIAGRKLSGEDMVDVYNSIDNTPRCGEFNRNGYETREKAANKSSEPAAAVAPP